MRVNRFYGSAASMGAMRYAHIHNVDAEHRS
jgi:hypothetical protein